MLRRFAVIPVLTLLVTAGLAQEAKKAKIEPADFKDPGPVAYKFTKDQTESYTTYMTTKSVVGVQVAGQDMTITTNGTTRARTSYKVLDASGPTKVEIVTDHLKMKQTVDTPMMVAEVTADDTKVKVTSGGQVIYDSESGADNPMASQFTQATKHIGKKVVITVDENGKAGPKVEGDAEAVKALRDVVSQGIFPVIWSGQSGLKVGDTWDIETELATMQQIELKKPMKIKNSYKVLGGALVDGAPCVELEVRGSAKASDMIATTEQGGMQIELKIGSMTMTMTGKAYYDPAKNRVVYADMKGTVEFEASGDIGGAGSMAIKATVDLAQVLRHNEPW